MNRQPVPVRVGQIELQMVARPDEAVDTPQFHEEWKDLHNPVLQVEERRITAVHTLDRFAFDHSQASDGELVWACEGCGAYSRTRLIVEAHEATCRELRD